MNANNKPLWQGIMAFLLVLLIGGGILTRQFISIYADEIFKGFPLQIYFKLLFYTWQTMIPTLLSAAFLGLGILFGRAYFRDNSQANKGRILLIVLCLAALVTFYKGFILPTQKVNAFAYLYQIRNTDAGDVVDEKDRPDMKSILESYNLFELKDSINGKKKLLAEERPNAISFLTQYASTSQIDSVLQTTPAKALNLKKEDFPEHLLNPNASMSYANVCLMTEFFATELKSTGILLKKLQWNYWDVIFSFFIYSIVTVLGFIIGQWFRKLNGWITAILCSIIFGIKWPLVETIFNDFAKKKELSAPVFFSAYLLIIIILSILLVVINKKLREVLFKRQVA